MVHSPVRFAVPINVALLTLVVVLDSSTARTGELDFDISFLSAEPSLVDVLADNLEAFLLDLSNKISEVVGVVFFLLVSPHEDEVGVLAFAVDRSVDEDVLEDPLGGDVDEGYFAKRTQLAFLGLHWISLTKEIICKK